MNDQQVQELDTLFHDLSLLHNVLVQSTRGSETYRAVLKEYQDTKVYIANKCWHYGKTNYPIADYMKEYYKNNEER